MHIMYRLLSTSKCKITDHFLGARHWDFQLCCGLLTRLTVSSSYIPHLVKLTCACSVTHPVVSDSAIPWTVAHQSPLFMEFSRQEYWSGLPYPTPGDLPNQRIEPASPALAGRFFTAVPPGKQEIDIQQPN